MVDAAPHLLDFVFFSVAQLFDLSGGFEVIARTHWKEANVFFFLMRTRNGGPSAYEEDCEEALEEVQEASERPQDMREGKTVPS